MHAIVFSSPPSQKHFAKKLSLADIVGELCRLHSAERDTKREGDQ